MPIGNYEVTIDRPAAEVFEHIADGLRAPTWRRSIIEAALRSGDGGEGSVWDLLVAGRGHSRSELRNTVLIYEPPHRYGVEVSSARVRGTATYTLSEADDGASTSVALHLDMHARGIWRGLGASLLRQMSAELDTLDALRALLS